MVATSILNIDGVTYNEFTVDIDKFMTNVFGEMMLYESGYLCFNAGWQVQNILLTLELAMKFESCLKVLIQSLSDWTNWQNIGS